MILHITVIVTNFSIILWYIIIMYMYMNDCNFDLSLNMLHDPEAWWLTCKKYSASLLLMCFPYFKLCFICTLASLDWSQLEKRTSNADPISWENRSSVMDGSGALSMLAQYSMIASLNLERAAKQDTLKCLIELKDTVS